MLRLTPSGAVYVSRRLNAVLRLDRRETEALGLGPLPSDWPGPETVHLEASSRCNRNCHYCYAPRNGNELQTEQWLRIIEKLGRWEDGPYQVTFGGGEPLLRNDIKLLAEHALSYDMNCCLTTNGTMPEKLRFRGLFTAVNVSYHGDTESLERSLDTLAQEGVTRGVNFLCAEFYMDDLDGVIRLCEDYDAELLLLAYKTDRDHQNIIPPERIREIARQVSGVVRVAVDGAAAGICTAAHRFVTIDTEGYLMPCSFVRRREGNLLQEHPDTIWKARQRYVRCPYFGVDNSHCMEVEL